MVDIHCHILPTIDDGASSMAESVALARMAWQSGVTKIAATPHFPGTAEAVELLPRILTKTRQLQQRLRELEIPVELVPGAEVLCLPQTGELARQGMLPTLGSGRYVLTEFHFDTPGEEITRMLDAVARFGYLPVVAHPERYDAVQDDPELTKQWFDRGWCLQMNKDSVFGLYGQHARQTALELLRWGAIHVIAGDAHHVRSRNTDFSRIKAWARDNLGPEYADVLLEQNPRRILRGQNVVEP